MKTEKKTKVAVVMASVAVLWASPLLAGNGGSEKVKVCHLPSEGATKGRVLMVSGNAVSAHMEHGDPATFVAFKDGSCEVYSEPAAPVAEPTPAPSEPAAPVAEPTPAPSEPAPAVSTSSGSVGSWDW